MHKYSDSLINAYINGEVIADYDIEQLEDDCIFMMQVINTSGDKKIYNLCSNNIKTNYEFVKFLIEKFSNDLEYISKVADTYISKEKDEVLRLEIILIMCKLTKNKDMQRFGFYKLLAEARFSEELFQVEYLKHDIDTDEEVINQIGMGFILVQEQYEGNEIILEYFAERFIEEIIWLYALSYEKMLHEKFNTYAELENYGVIKYMIDYVAKHDYFLSEYLACHKNVFDFLIVQLPKIKKNWGEFENRNEQRKYELILDYIHEYMGIYESECSFTEFELLIHMGKKFKIENELKKYDFIDAEIYKILETRNLDESILSISDIRHYTFIKKFIQLVLSNKITKKPSEEEILNEKVEENSNNNVKTRCRIIKFPGVN